MQAWCPFPSHALPTARAVAASCGSGNPPCWLSVRDGILWEPLCLCQTGHGRNDGWTAAEVANPAAGMQVSGAAVAGGSPQPRPFDGGLTASLGGPTPAHAFLLHPPNVNSVQIYMGSELVPTLQRTMTGGWACAARPCSVSVARRDAPGASRAQASPRPSRFPAAPVRGSRVPGTAAHVASAPLGRRAWHPAARLGARPNLFQHCACKFLYFAAGRPPTVTPPAVPGIVPHSPPVLGLNRAFHPPRGN